MLMQKREQAYYNVFSYFLKQTLKEKKNIEENIFILEQFVSTAEQCLKCMNAQKLNNDFTLKASNCVKHKCIGVRNKKIVLLRRKIEIRQAKLIVNSKSNAIVHPESNQQCDGKARPVILAQKSETNIKKEDTDFHSPQPKTKSDSLPTTPPILVDAQEENLKKKPEESSLVQIIITSQSFKDEQWYDSDQSDSSLEINEDYLKPNFCLSFKNKRLCQSCDNLLMHNQSETAHLSCDTLGQWRKASSTGFIDSNDESSLIYDPVSFANTVIKKKKRRWLSGSKDYDICGDYYFCRTNSKPNIVKQAMTNLSKKCRQSMLELTLCGSRDINENKEFKKHRPSHLRSAIGRLLSRLRNQDNSKEYTMLGRSWSTPYNLNNI